ncbi:MAG TPA: pitrilysin family protein [Candidatus Limnocylindrales bacterium]|nr:pitrilysin family protein [Candidatus Limnocylindrales bacterium]
MSSTRLFSLALALILSVGMAGAQTKAKRSKLPASAAAKAPAAGLHVPVEYYKLPNGLRVVLSPDHTAPTVAIAVYYRIGFRVEPRDRTGFAHLFEHMMFQGSQNLGKMEFIRLVQKNGGILNGSTRFDFTNYFEALPSNKLETMLWAEADRMRGLNITEENLKNQQGVVGNEVKVNVLNRPYGGFPWLDIPQYANTNWYNAHNFYGDLKDIEAAKVPDVEKFFKTYYVPSNAALAVVGDFDPAQAKKWITKYFAAIPSPPQPRLPDLTEPRQDKEKRATKIDAQARRPAIAVAYHMPQRNTPEYYAMGIINQLLLQGDDSRFHDELVKKRALTDEVDGGVNLLGNMYNYNGPMLWTAYLFYDNNVKPDTVVSAMDSVIEPLQKKPIDQKTLDRSLVKLRSSLYDSIGNGNGIGLADLLCSFALFDDNPARINTLESQFRKITPALIQKTAQEYLRPGNHTVLVLEPKAAADEPAKPGAGN